MIEQNYKDKSKDELIRELTLLHERVNYAEKEILDLRTEVERTTSTMVELEIANQRLKIELAKYEPPSDILHDNQERYRTIIKIAKEGIWIIDTESKTTFVNPKMAEMLGYTIDEMLGQSFFDFMDSEEQHLAAANVEERRYGITEQHEFSFRRKDGQVLWTLINTTAFFDKKGNYAGALGMITDVTKRKETEERLKLLQRAISATTNGIAITGTDETDYALLYVNRGFERITGYQAEEVLGQNSRFLQAGDHNQPALEELRKALKEERDCQVILRNYHKDGTLFWNELHIAPVHDQEGRLMHFVGVQNDITERKLAEQAIEDQRAFLQQVIDINPHFIFAKDRQGRFTLANHAFAEAYGTTVEELLGKTDADFNPNEGLVGKFLRDDLRVMDSRQELSIPEEQMIKSNGEVRWRQTVKRPLIGANNQVNQVLGVVTDITERKVADEALQKAHDELELRVEERTAELLLVNQHLRHEITERQRAEEALEAERASLAQRVAERTAQLSMTNQKLARAMRAKDEFLANMSHELRTPLSAILLLNELLQTQHSANLTSNQLKSLHTIEESARHLLELINDILDIAKVESGKLELNNQPVLVQTICQSSLRFVRQNALKKELNLFFNIHDPFLTIEADERRLKQILVNLLSNAVKFTPSGGKVALEVYTESEQQVIHFVVSDTGIGMTKEELERAFKPFEQIDNSLSRQHEGSGLGLALVKQLTRLQGGTVSVQSEVGIGTRFTISLPRTTVLPNATDESVTPPTQTTLSRLPFNPKEVSNPRSNCHILLAEDNKINSKILADYLKNQGYQVTMAYNGYETIEKAQQVEPSLILMDIQMPDIDGLEATRQIRTYEALKETPIIALTALAMSGDRERCLAAGANDYLSKPISLMELVSCIEKWL